MRNRRTISVKSGNRGLAVTLNLFALDPRKFNSEAARMWMKGQVVNPDTLEKRFFQDGGELLSVLGEWNRKKLAENRRDKAYAKD